MVVFELLLGLALVVGFAYLLFGVVGSFVIISSLGHKHQLDRTGQARISALEDLKDVWSWPWYFTRFMINYICGDMYRGIRALIGRK